ncbi:hypothetical protein B0H14DRAFT_2569842 [Mycena olivaceomarginata]|nr:hypothetical protein B0H14DRAFT_2569842 [Mycena olivaceomarginata]
MSSPPSSSSDQDKSRPQSRPNTRQTRSDFDLEPNPFEQSFSAPKDDAPKQKDRSASPPRPTLPPLASIASPADQANYAWANFNSLRAGPLSPAMLAGPQNSDNHSQPSHLQASPRAPASLREPGLTPATGLTPIVGGPSAFPASPGTAAFIAAMTPNTINAITSDYAGANAATSSAANGLFLLSQAHQELTKREEAARGNANAQQQQQPQGTVNGSAVHGNQNGNGAQNGNGKRGTKRKTSPLANNGHAAPPPPPQPAMRKRARGNTTSSFSSNRRKDSEGRRGRRTTTRSMDGMDDGMHDEPASNGGGRRSKKPETEEEKAQELFGAESAGYALEFLSLSTALKCRQRKKAWLASLQTKVEFLQNENERLTLQLVASREEISRLGALVGAAAPGPQLPAGSAPVAVNVSVAKVGGGGGRGGGGGYGY